MNEDKSGEWIFLWTRKYDCTRYFLHKTKRRVSVCDMSGDNPSLSEDGPLYLDRNRCASIYKWRGRIAAHLPVEDEQGSETLCSVHVQDLLWLVKNGFWDLRFIDIEDDEELRDLYELVSLKVRHGISPTETLRSTLGDHLQPYCGDASQSQHD